MLPAFDESGNLPEGIYQVPEAEVFAAFASGSIGPVVLDMWLDTYQTTREYGRRGIVEVLLS